MTSNLTPTPQADILIVDDNPNNLRLLGQILGKIYKVRLAPSGLIALTAARSALPDLILLDVMMPELNGFEVAAQLKAEPQTAEIPLIFISALDDTESKLQAFAAGGVDYIPKPFQEREVLARVEIHLELRRLYRQAQVEIVQRQAAEALLLRRNQEMATLYETSLEINALSNLETLLRAIVQRACALLKIPAGALYLFRPAEALLELVVAYQLPEDWVGAKIRPGEGLAGDTFLLQKPLVVEDYLTWSGRLDNFKQSPARRVLCVPLKIHDQVTGVLVLLDQQVGGFSNEEIRLVSLFADQAAVAVANVQFAAELETRVMERTEALQAANAELESLSYTIAHDMRSPVRAVLGYVGILEQTRAGSFDEQGRQYLESIRSAGLRLGVLIDGFLDFLRLGQTTVRFQPVEMLALVRASLVTLAAEQENRQFEISLGVLPDCLGDPKLLEQVWCQLISNALKFTRSRPQARIEIGSVFVDQQPAYFVRDNGIGFEMKYAAKLFGVFQKLHSEAEYEGTGIGLAIAGRIIKLHGGRIWAEAEVDQGATFYFTL
jgi:signal transduction histidine kinase/DNA-binding response OmpR family regulator